MLMATLRLAQARLPGLVRAIAPARSATEDDERARARKEHDPNPDCERDGRAPNSAFIAGTNVSTGAAPTVELDAGSVRVAAHYVQRQLRAASASIVNAAPKALVHLFT